MVTRNIARTLVLAAICGTLIGCGHRSRARAHLMAMESSLNSFRDAQGAYHSTHGRYASDQDSLDFFALKEVEVQILIVIPEGYAAVAYNPTRVPGYGCAVYWGTVNPPRTERGTSPTGPGVVTCDDPKGARVLRD